MVLLQQLRRKVWKPKVFHKIKVSFSLFNTLRLDADDYLFITDYAIEEKNNNEFTIQLTHTFISLKGDVKASALN